MHDRTHIFMVSPQSMLFDSAKLPRLSQSFFKSTTPSKTNTDGESGESQKEGGGKEKPPVLWKLERAEKVRGKYSVRAMELRDLDQVLEIEKQSFTRPYTRGEFTYFVKAAKLENARYPFFPFVVVVGGGRRGEDNGSGNARENLNGEVTLTNENEEGEEEEVAAYMVGQKKLEWRSDMQPPPSTGDDNDDNEDEDDETLYYAHGISMAVSKKFRRSGMAKALMFEAVKLAKSLSCKYISLNVSVHNVPAQKLYSSNGFQTTRWKDEFFTFDARSGEKMKLGDHVGDAIHMSLFIDEEYEKRVKEAEKRRAENK